MFKSILTLSCALMLSSFSILETQASENVRARILTQEEMFFQYPGQVEKIENNVDKAKPSKIKVWEIQIEKTCKKICP